MITFDLFTLFDTFFASILAEQRKFETTNKLTKFG